MPVSAGQAYPWRGRRRVLGGKSKEKEISGQRSNTFLEKSDEICGTPPLKMMTVAIVCALPSRNLNKLGGQDPQRTLEPVLRLRVLVLTCIH